MSCKYCEDPACKLTKKVIFIDGISGGRKSSLIYAVKNLFPNNFETIFMDFPDYLDRFGGHAVRESTLLSPEIQLQYLTKYVIFVRNQLQVFNQRKVHVLVDRSEFNSLFYGAVFRMLNKSDEFKKKYLQEQDALEYEFKIWSGELAAMDPDYQIIIIVNADDSEFPEMLDEMRKRNNNIDTFSIEYMKVQQVVFARFYRRYKEWLALNGDKPAFKVVYTNRFFLNYDVEAAFTELCKLCNK